MSQSLKSVGPEGWRIPWGFGGDERWTYALLKATLQPLTVNNPQAARLKHTYVLFSGRSDQDPMDQMLKGVLARTAERVGQTGWNYAEWPFGHIFYLEQHSHEAFKLLMELVWRPRR